MPNCTVCGKPAGFFSSAHPQCAQAQLAEERQLLSEARGPKPADPFAPLIAEIRGRRNEDLMPVDGLPTLYRLNGMGFGLYGHTGDDQASGTYVKTYYVSVAWLPFFPICRYRVRDALEGGWVFVGELPLRRLDIIRPLLVLGAVAVVVYVFSK